MPGVEPLPQWRLGQSWTHAWEIPSQGVAFSTEVVVTNATASGYQLASDTLEMALFHASFIFPDLGTMATDLSGTTQGAFRFPWYSFPLEDGKRWTAVMEDLDFQLQPVRSELTLTATLRADSPRQVFDIEARDAAGLQARYDYDPEVGWFTEFFGYEGGEDPEAWMYRIRLEGHQPDWSGTWYRSEGELVVQHLNILVPPAGYVQPAVATSFQLRPDATHFMGLLFSFAEGGAHDAQVVAPDGTRHHATVAGGAGIYHADGANIVQVEAQPGTYHVSTVGAGAVAAGGGVFGWSHKVSQGHI